MIPILKAAAAALLLALPACPAIAADQDAPAAATPPPADPVPFANAASIGSTDLAKVTGRDDTAQDVRAQNTASVSHNSVSGQSQTGTIAFDAQAFQNMAGLSLLSANTGNNVSINSSLNVNVAIRP